MRDVTQYGTLSAERSEELKQVYKTNGHTFDCAQASQTRAHRVPHSSTPATWQYTETQGIGKHNQGRPEPVALESHAKNQTHFALSTKKTKGKQRPQIQVYCTIDKDHNIKHYIKIKNKVFNATTDTKGRVTNTNIIYTGPTETLHPAARWGPGYKGPTIDAYPLPEEFSFEDTRIPLDKITVRTLTQLFSNKTTKKPNCIANWNKKLGPENIPEPNWEKLSAQYTTGFLDPRDFHLHFKHIVHRALVTRQRIGHITTRCRLCHSCTETSIHLGKCYHMRALFQRIKRLYPDLPTITTERILFCFHEDKLPRAIYHIIQILWRFALIAFYRVDIELEPFKPNDIWSNTIRRFTELAAAKSAHLLIDLRRYEARATPPPDDFLEKYNNYIKPIAKYTIQGKINATPQLLTELKKYNITNYTKLFEPDSVKTPQAQPRPNYFHSWTRGSLVTPTAKTRPHTKAHTPTRTHTPLPHTT